MMPGVDPVQDVDTPLPDGPSPDEAVPDEPRPSRLPWLRHGPDSGRLAPLTLAALGVVFGDIGTSPLYALQTVFSIDHNAVEPSRLDVFGIISLVLWSITIVVSVKYVGLVMRADNEGEGGILALVALLVRRLAGRPRLTASALVLGMVGAALFYGDSVITPAISVMSAVEGLTLVNADATRWVLPASLVILTVLFSVQRWGTGAVGKAFGPVMVAWFVTVAVLGMPHIAATPEILGAISPTHALAFAIQRPLIAFIAMGAVVLTITGAEALYADMGHFGRRPIQLAWFGLVFPCLAVNYLGQGALLLAQPAAIENPFFLLAPDWARLPLVVLATLATIVASQAVISGAFSVSSQAARLRLLPRLKVRHTSKQEGGQIYIGSINWLLFVGVVVLTSVFQSSVHLANAYGLAVTGTLVLTTLLLLFLARYVWGWSRWRMLLVTVGVGGLEAVFFAANVAKIAQGGWIPLVIAGLVILVMTSWKDGSEAVRARRAVIEGPLEDFVERVKEEGVVRVPGTAVYLHPDAATTPLALRNNYDINHVLHERTVIVSVTNLNVPHVRHVERAQVRVLGAAECGIVHIEYRVGFTDTQDVPRALYWGAQQAPELGLDPDTAWYFVSVLRLQRGATRHSLPRWRERLFLWLAAAAANRGHVFHLPPERMVVMGGALEV